MCSDMPLPASYATEAEKVDALWVTVTAADREAELFVVGSGFTPFPSRQTELFAIRSELAPVAVSRP